MNSYVVASNKFWHRKAFDEIAAAAGEWNYVTTQSELDRILKTIEPRYIFFLHWSSLVPKEIWSRYECVCFHMTDVPYGRGGSPLQNLIGAGHDKTKVTALRMVEEMDAGPVYAKRPMSLEGRAEEIYMRAGEISWDIIRWMIGTNPKPVPQEGEVTKFSRRKPEQSVLPSRGDLERVFDHIRMLDAPTYPLAYIDNGEFRLRFSEASIENGEIQAKVTISRIENDNGNGE